MNHLKVSTGDLTLNSKSSAIVENNLVNTSRAISPTFELDDSKDLIRPLAVTNLELPASTCEQPMMNISAVLNDIHFDNLQLKSPVKSSNMLSLDYLNSNDSTSTSTSSPICRTDNDSIDVDVKSLEYL